MVRLINDLMGIWAPWHVAVQDVMQRGDHNTRQLGTSAMKNGSIWAPQMTYWTNPFPWLHFGSYNRMEWPFAWISTILDTHFH